MTEPTIAANKPAVLELEPGSYWWCQCGRSKNQPFCDGSHQGTEFEPIEIEVGETKWLALCQCKRSDNAPLCDGTHARL